MSGQGAGEGREETPHEAQLLSARRLFLIVVLFLVLAAYSIWNSDRFQTLFRAFREQRLSELLQRPVSFRRVDFHVFPPSIALADVRIGNDPRLRGEPLLSAGGADDRRRRLGHGRRAAASGACARSRPESRWSSFEDGTWNLPPGLTGPGGEGRALGPGRRARRADEASSSSKGGPSGIDGRLDEFAVELVVARRAALPRHPGLPPCRRSDCPAPSRWSSASTCASGSTPRAAPRSKRFASSASSASCTPPDPSRTSRTPRPCC